MHASALMICGCLMPLYTRTSTFHEPIRLTWMLFHGSDQERLLVASLPYFWLPVILDYWKSWYFLSLSLVYFVQPGQEKWWPIAEIMRVIPWWSRTSWYLWLRLARRLVQKCGRSLYGGRWSYNRLGWCIGFRGLGWSFCCTLMCRYEPGRCRFPVFLWMQNRWMGGTGAASNALSFSLCLESSVKCSLDRASATKLSESLMYFKVTPYSSKVSCWWRTQPNENFVDECTKFLWSMWMVTRWSMVIVRNCFNVSIMPRSSCSVVVYLLYIGLKLREKNVRGRLLCITTPPI